MNVERPAESFMVLPGMKPVYTSDPTRPGEKRLPGFGWLPNRIRRLFISMLGEFVGTYLFLFFAFAATQVANTSPNSIDNPASTSTLLYISLAFGFSLAVNVWIFFRISGGLFNPAVRLVVFLTCTCSLPQVTVGLALVGAIGWIKAVLLILAQILGAICAAGIVSCLFPGPLAVRTRLGHGTSIKRGLFIEMLLTAELIFTIFMLAAEKHRATFLAPIGIGLALFIAELAGTIISSYIIDGHSLRQACISQGVRSTLPVHSAQMSFFIPLMGIIGSTGSALYLELLWPFYSIGLSSVSSTRLPILEPTVMAARRDMRIATTTIPKIPGIQVRSACVV